MSIAQFIDIRICKTMISKTHGPERERFAVADLPVHCLCGTVWLGQRENSGNHLDRHRNNICLFICPVQYVHRKGRHLVLDCKLRIQRQVRTTGHDHQH